MCIRDRQRRYHVVSHPAVRHTVGNRGGVMILALKGLHIKPYRDIKASTKMWTAIIISTSGSRGSSSNILVGTLYLPGDDEALNLATMHDISMVNKNVHCPVMWVGD